MIRSKRFSSLSAIVDSCRGITTIMVTCNIRPLVVPFLIACVLFLPATVLAQVQLGTDIDGEVSQLSSEFRVSLSSDGNRLAIGAPNHDGNGHRSGRVRIFQWSGTAWTQLGANIDGEAAGDFFGSSLSLSSDGNRLAIGAPFNSGNGSDSGHVRVFQWSGSSWEQLGTDIDGDEAGDMFFKSSLSSEGSRLAIGAGYSRIYEWSGTAWTQIGADIVGDAGDGVSLSADGNRFAIGDSWSDTNGSYSGHVRVHEWSGSAWVQVGNDIGGEAMNDFSGGSVSLSSDGGRVAIGASSNDGNGDDSGHVRVFQWSGTAWEQLGADIDGEAADDESGRSVSLSSDGNRLVIGAHRNDGNGENSGHMRVYKWSGNAWTQLGIDIDGEWADDNFGSSVSISSDGNRVASGSGRFNAPGDVPGQVSVYDLSMFNIFKINPGLNDAWYNPDTDGQGFFITVFPDLGAVSLAWFTYDTELPAMDATANLGDPGDRWLTAVGPIVDNQVLMEIELTSDGLFDSSAEVARTDPPGSDGTIMLTFDGCNSATVEYDIPSINRQGIVSIRRVANDNIVICEALKLD